MRLHLVSALGATLAFAGSALAQQPSGIGSAGQPVAAAQPSLALEEAAAQLKSDKAALERAQRRLEIDEAKLKSDTASGRMSAESKDAMKVYTDEQFVKGERTAIAADKTGSLQMKADKTALQRALKRLEGDEAKLKSDTASGRMSAESKDAMKVYTDEQFVKGERTDIAGDKAKVGSQPANTSGQILPRRFSESQVREIQQALDDKEFKSGKVDGSWGPETEAAFKDFQKWAMLSPTGEVDSISIALLGLNVTDFGLAGQSNVPDQKK